MSAPEIRPGHDLSITPVALVDAGGAPWERVEQLLSQRLGELRDGEVLALISVDPAIWPLLDNWCLCPERKLVGIWLEEGSAVAWIGKSRDHRGHGSSGQDR